MAVATSPYVQNDYQAASSYRPYQLPVNDIFKAISAQNQYWDQGAAVVKNAYNNALGLDLTLDKNKAVRDEYMKETEKQITKLSSMDLSDPSVQRQGLALFDGLYANKALMFDHQITKVQGNIFNTARDYKNKKLSSKGVIGEGFNEVNLADALDGFENFRPDADLSEQDLKQLYENVKHKEYIPYYDFTQDFERAMKNCKGQTTRSETPNGLDNTVMKTSGVGAMQLKACLDSGLSTQGRTQMMINARQNFKNDKPGLIRAITPLLTKNIVAADTAIKEIEARQAALLSANLTDEDFVKQYGVKKADVIKGLDESLEELRTQKQGYQDNYNNISANNWESIDKDFDNWAAQVYTDGVLEAYATPRATLSQEQTLESNAGQIARFNANHSTNMEMLRHQNKLVQQREQAFLTGSKGKDGKSTGLSTSEKLRALGQGMEPGLELMLGSAVAEGHTTSSQIEELLDENADGIRDAANNVYMNLSTVPNALKMTGLEKAPETQTEFEQVINSARTYMKVRTENLKPGETLNQSEEEVLNYLNDYDRKVSYSKNMEIILKDARDNAEIDPQNVQEYEEDMIGKITTLPDNILLTNGEYLSRDRVKGVFEGTDPDYEVKLGFSKPSIVDGGIISSTVGSNYHIVKKGSEEKIFARTNTDQFNFHQLAATRKDYENKVVSKIDEKLSENQVINRLFVVPTEADHAEADRLLKAIFPGAQRENIRFNVGSINMRTGEMSFKIFDDSKDGKELDLNSVKDLQKQFGNSDISPGAVRYDRDKKTFYFKNPGLGEARDYLDEGMNMAMSALSIQAQKERKPKGQVIHSTTQGEFMLEAIPNQGGSTTYALKIRPAGKKEFMEISGKGRMRADEVNTTVKTYIQQFTRPVTVPQLQ